MNSQPNNLTAPEEEALQMIVEKHGGNFSILHGNRDELNLIVVTPTYHSVVLGSVFICQFKATTGQLVEAQVRAAGLWTADQPIL
jgi:hypothetical protein